MKRNLAIIPARSGSKRLPDKNVRLLAGKPLLAYSIEAAKLSNLFCEIMVSTESKEYQQIAQHCGASVPFLRSNANSTDQASSWDMIREVLHCYVEIGWEFDTVTLLQPTSPLRTAEDILCCHQILEKRCAEAVVSVCEAEHPLFWYNTLPEDGSMKHFLRSDIPKERYYRLNGALYVIRTEYIKRMTDLYAGEVYAYIMDTVRSVDIDTLTDFQYVDFLISNASERE